MTLNVKTLTTTEVLQNLGMRFRDYRLRLKMTRKEVSESAGIGMTTLYKFETGRMSDISLRTLLKLLRVIGMEENWTLLLPELPESPYLFDSNGKKKQRIRHSTK